MGKNESMMKGEKAESAAEWKSEREKFENLFTVY